MSDPMIDVTIISMLVRGACLTVLAIALAVPLYRRCSAHTLTMLWRGTLAALCLLPLLSILAPPIPILPSRGAAPVEAPSGVTPVTGTISERPEPATATGAVATPAAPAAIAESGSIPWLVLVWCAGLAMVFSRWLFALSRVRQLWNSGRPVDAPGWSDRAGVRLRVSDEVSLPMTWGVRRPSVLLPGDAEEWDEGTRRAVIDHELAHARGGDSRFLLIAQLATAIHWMNPLVWLIGRRLRESQERVADDSVLATGHDAGDYASLLLAFARRRSGAPPLPASAMAHPSTVGKRIERVLDGGQHRGQLGRPARLCGSLVVIATTALVAAAAPKAARLPDADDNRTAGAEVAHDRGQANRDKLSSIILPKVELTDVTLTQAIDLLSGLVEQHDPDKDGVPFRLVNADPDKVAIAGLNLVQVPALETLKYIAQLAGVEHIIKSTGVEIGEGVARGRATRRFNLPEKLADKIASAPSAEAYWSKLGVDLPDGSRISAPAEQGGSMSAEMVTEDGLQTIEEHIAQALRAGDKPPPSHWEKKLDGMIVPQVEFDQATPEEAIDFVRRKSLELDPKKNGVNFVIQVQRGGKPEPEERRITLSLKNASLKSIVMAIAEQGHMTADLTGPAAVVLLYKPKD